MKKIVGLVLALFFLAAFSCSEPKTEQVQESASVVLMTWNVQNVFDGVDNGLEYDEFKESASWSVEKYLGRINAMSAAIEAIQPAPDIIILQEVESLLVLDDLAVSLQSGYKYSRFGNSPGASLGLGMLSRIPLGESRVHSITINNETTPRPVLETRVDTDSGSFVIFACHWKSKLGSEEETEKIRRSSARVILRRCRELWKEEPGLGVIVTGDLNENHDEFTRVGGKYICALMPDDVFAAEMAGGEQTDFLIIAKNSPPSAVNFSASSIVFYSPWTSDLQDGTYFYKYNWETIDHFLLSNHFFNNSGLDYETALIANYPPFVNASGIPLAFNIRTGMGLSDHLPLLIRLRINE